MDISYGLDYRYTYEDFETPCVLSGICASAWR